MPAADEAWLESQAAPWRLHRHYGTRWHLRLDADEAWLERLIAAKASLLKDGLLSEFTSKFDTICAAHSD